ncbi:unnamed protein product [Trichogramma brassicae]|uniref:Uncharacterized protein n=1 Tax=Trichogramma brassicae TaxID=86971 RepID=A0A6H5J558_9HYME|nr:unnamed protein product [Trichogramma brassicae]
MKLWRDRWVYRFERIREIEFSRYTRRCSSSSSSSSSVYVYLCVQTWRALGAAREKALSKASPWPTTHIYVYI